MPTSVKAGIPGAVVIGLALATLSESQADRRILLVEDNQFVARQCEMALRKSGYEIVDVVATADDAVRVALERRPQLVLMDIYLQGKRDGVDAATEILQRGGIRSIFASALADPMGKARADAAQPLAWLAKPFNDGKLVATVASAIEHFEEATQHT
jgi:two-component system, response regulator PdtaR